MTHIILLDGKLWAFEPPDKPASMTRSQNMPCDIPCGMGEYPGCECLKEKEAYNLAYSLALEQRIEVENPEEAFQMVYGIPFKKNAPAYEEYKIKPNEPIKWEGGFETVLKCQYMDIDGNCDDCFHGHLCAKLVRLIAPVKEENSVVDNLAKLGWIKPSLDTVNEIPDGPGNNYTPFGEPVPSEQENQVKRMEQAIMTAISDLEDLNLGGIEFVDEYRRVTKEVKHIVDILKTGITRK